MAVMYTAVERFDPSCGTRWQKFVDWARLPQLRQVISLDGTLCPKIVRELNDEDWEHNVLEDGRVYLFRDLDYLQNRVAENHNPRILAIAPVGTATQIESINNDRLVFRGFDLVDGVGGISALVNCGGFEKAFDPSELSDSGLLTDLRRALEVQRLLQSEYPDEHHADCELWAIWELKSITPNAGSSNI